MNDDNLKSQVDLFKSIFKGREDIFAIRWEKGKKSGYMPAYFYDKYRYRVHKMKGGSFQNFTEKAYLPYSEEQIGKTPDSQTEGNLLDLNQLQTVGNGKLFESEEELLENILKDKTLKHYRHIRYLASKHAKDIQKMRFVLSPFSFVFLLSGTEQFHIIMETLDTEEATYIWHINKDINSLKNELKKIDIDINLIRNDGRQAFLENQPQDFTRIIHDYSGDRKGFIIWKDLLEEILF